MPPKTQSTRAKSSTPIARPQSAGRRSLAPQMAPAYRSKQAPRTIKRQTVVTRSRDPNTKLAQETRTTYENPYVAQTRKPGEASAARKRGRGGGSRAGIDLDKPKGIGLLEAEFFLCLALLVLIMFTSKTSLADKIVSTLKRGTLTCVAFFILALIATVGPRAMMVAKAIGALIVAALLLTAPVVGVDKDLDNLIKNDWVATNASSGNAPEQTQTPAGFTSIGTAISSAIAGALAGLTAGGVKPTPGVIADIKAAVSGVLANFGF